MIRIVRDGRMRLAFALAALTAVGAILDRDSHGDVGLTVAAVTIGYRTGR